MSILQVQGYKPLAFTLEPLLSPVSRPLYYVLRDWERTDFEGYIKRPNLPCVFRCGELVNNTYGHYSQLDADWQFFLMDLLCLSYFGKPRKELTKVERDWMAKRTTAVYAGGRAFANNKGLDQFRNYLTGERMTAGLPAIYTLVCGGASVTGTKVINAKGVPMLKVDHFDHAAGPPPIESIDIRTDPRIFFATTITGTKKGDGYAVYRFPQLEGKDVPIPLIAMTDIYYPMNDLRAVTGTVKPSPYWP
jgi:hypothetical protein